MALEQKQSVVVMGGGPAGVFTACGLADLGIQAIIISRPRPFPAWEGLSERPRVSLQKFGFDKTLAAIGPQVARMAHWNGTATIQNREYILERRQFDRVLLEDARDKGVEVIEGRVEKVSRHGGGWRISCRTAGGEKTLTTGFLVEARGREAKLGRKFFDADGGGTDGETVTAPATSALLKSYRLSPELPAMTSVASFAKGWAWYLRDGKGVAILQIFVDSDRGNLPSKSGLEDYFSALVRQIPEAEEWLDGVERDHGAVSVRTAAATMTLPAGGKNFLVAGDGALALDPLSGNGIFYAIGSGLAAVPVINNLINRPQDGDLARQFYQDRIELAFRGGCRSAGEFYGAEQRWPDEPFWHARSHWLPASSATTPGSQAVEFCKKPVVKNGFISVEDVIVTADYPRGVWQVDTVPLVPFLHSLRADDGRIFPGVTATQMMSARTWLVSHNIID